MRGHGVLRNVELTGYFAGCHAIGFVADQQTEHIQARSLRQRPKRNDSRIIFHISSIADIQSTARPCMALARAMDHQAEDEIAIEH